MEDKIPIKKGDTKEVTIISTGRKGDGVAKINDFIIVVTGAKENRTYEIEITKVMDSYGFAKIIQEVKK